MADSTFRGYVVRRVSDGAAVYVGITKAKSVACRWSGHCTDARRGATTAMAAAIRKYGADAFMVEHLWSSRSYSELQEAETIVIAQMRTRSPSGYNLTDGGDGFLGISKPGKLNSFFGRKHSEESLAAMRAAKLGKVMVDETRAKLVVALTGRPVSSETRAKMRAKQLGKTMSAEAREKMVKVRTGKPLRKRTTQERARQSANMIEIRASRLDWKPPPGGRKQSSEERARRSVKMTLIRASRPDWGKRKAKAKPTT